MSAPAQDKRVTLDDVEYVLGLDVPSGEIARIAAAAR